MELILCALMYVAIFVLALAVSKVKYHRIINVVSVFTGIWCLFGVLSFSGLTNLRKPNVVVHMCAWAFVLTVDVVILALTKTSKSCVETTYSRNLSLTRAMKLEVLSICLTVPLLVQVIPLLLSSGLTAVRVLYFSSGIFNIPFGSYFFKLIPISFLNALIIFFVLYSFKTKSYKYLIYSAFNAVYITVLNGGRYALLLLVYMLVIVWISRQLNGWQMSGLRKYKTKLIKIGVFFLVVMVAITVMRGQNIVRSGIAYFTGSLSFLDLILENPVQFALDDPLYGYLTFGAVLEPIVLVMKGLGLTTIKIPSYEFNIYCQNFYDIGDGVTAMFNANTSVLYYFIRDFSYLGVIIGGVFLGILVATSYNRWRRGNWFWGMLFCYFTVNLFNTIMTYQFFGQAPIFSVIAFYFCTKKFSFPDH